MRRVILVRIGQLVIVVLVTTTVAFVVLRLLPGDPARVILGIHASPGAIAAENRTLGVDRPIVLQYLSWLGGFVKGDFGQSFEGGSVTHLVSAALPVTVELAAGALTLGLVFGVLVALLSARRPGGIVDTGLTAYSVVAGSVPSFVWGLGLVLVASLTLRILPSAGYVSPFSSPIAGLKSLLLPTIALSLPAVGNIARVSRASLIENLNEPYIQFARGKGLPWRRVYAVHALLNSMVAITAVGGAEFGYILGDVIAVEYVFSMPGLGQLVMSGFLARDYPTIQGAVIAIAMLVVLGNLAADLIAMAIDPRIRQGKAPAGG